MQIQSIQWRWNMSTTAEKGSHSLDATADLKDLLRLAHSALHRLQQDVHGSNYDEIEILSYKLHDLRNDADKLSENIALYVKELETKTYG